jgi:mRNA interferase MazF
LAAPFTEWKKEFDDELCLVKIKKTETNGLEKDSAVNVLQLWGLSIERFTNYHGKLTANELEEISYAIALVIGLEVK